MPVVIVGVLVVAELGARTVGPNIPRKSGSEERAYIKADQMYRRGQTDVAFVGASETAGGIIPSVVMRQVPSLDGGYNAALSGASLEVTEAWTRKVVIPALDPKVVVVGFIPGVAIDYRKLNFDVPDDPSPAYQSAFDIIAPGGLGTFGWKLRQRSALIRYRPELREPTDVLKGIRNTLSGGIEQEKPRDDRRLDFQKETHPELVKANTEPTGEILDYRAQSVPGDDTLAAAAFTYLGSRPFYPDELKALIDTIRAGGAEPVIAVAPIDRERLLAAGSDLSNMDDLLAEEQAWFEEQGVPVFSEFDTEWPADHFHDREHVAEIGARRWSKELGEWLEQQCQDDTLGDAC